MGPRQMLPQGDMPNKQPSQKDRDAVISWSAPLERNRKQNKTARRSLTAVDDSICPSPSRMQLAAIFCFWFQMLQLTWQVMQMATSSITISAENEVKRVEDNIDDDDQKYRCAPPPPHTTPHPTMNSPQPSNMQF